MKYESIVFWTHKDFREYLNERTDIVIIDIHHYSDGKICVTVKVEGEKE